MKKAIIIAALFWSLPAFAGSFENVRDKAMHGDYQAQRNLAYGYSSHPYAGQEKSPLLACAWRKLILRSGSEKVDQTDTNNFQVYCGQLTEDQQRIAEAQAQRLFAEIYKR
ncbi:hypothetical protein [Mariprofundus ferrooxydans]|uniref:Uncharacterized protein n=1 Tax=Mariprofundus ferrooxydans PV-1 TaxID=314345 RepID=Q0EWC4_9PROT|nr:hypothetical protein [Mariprofundus ferrooxydans]EAU53547.1 hypothetical protein SPV1_02878 [Mariprofundus ferrooxydans PV-1]KON47005.1 hypothetical protein AL013_10455 [Mariprofundus ferrooxydans]